MRFISLLALIFSYLVNSFGQCVDSSLINPDAICITLYAPVCGCNGITYSNSCVATNLGGVTSWTEGECGTLNPCTNTAQIDSTIMCPTVYEPVCGCDSITYSNSCVAQYYAGITSWTFGPCENSINFSDSCAELSSIDFGEWDKEEIDLDRLFSEWIRILKDGGTLILFYDIWNFFLFFFFFFLF